jgi:ABC-type sugar transport system substrate-binding protein
MKKAFFSIVFVFFLLAFLVSGCNKAAPSDAQITEISQADVMTPTINPEPNPSEEPTPTAVPEPLGCTIAFDSDRDGNQEIYSMASDGSELVNLTNDPGADSDPSWSPDGSQIAFVSNRENDAEGGQFIYVMNVDGSNVRQLSVENESQWPDWSPDGIWITYENKGDIYKIKADGSGQPVNLTNNPEQDIQPAWSPDGTNIAWLSGSDGHWNIFLINPDGSDLRQLTTDGKVTYVTWTIDGQIFTIWDNQEAHCMKCVMDADGSNVKEAGGKGELQQYLPFWTLDGNRVECISGANIFSPDEEIYLVGEIFPDIFLNLTNNPAQDRNPDWPANCLLNREPLVEEIPTSTTSSDIVIGYAGDEPSQKQRADDFQKACTELGIECIYGTIPELTAKGVSAIVQNTNNVVVPGLHQNILNARDKGIPVILLDAESGTDGAYSVTIDHERWVITSLKWTLDKMGGKGQFAYFDLDPFNRYSDIINKVLGEYPDVTVVDKRDGMYDTSKIKPEFSDFLRQYPDIKGIWTSYDNFQTMLGLEENGFTYEQWPVMVCDDTLDCLIKWKSVVSAYPSFEMRAIGNPPGIAYDAVYVAYYLASGLEINESALSGPYGKSLYVEIPIVGNDNLQEWIEIMDKNNVDRVDYFMSPEEIREKWFQN